MIDKANLSKNFWFVASNVGMQCKDIVLYMYLLNEVDEANGCIVSVDNKILKKIIGVKDKRTLRKINLRLDGIGFVKFIAGRGKRRPAYEILNFDKDETIRRLLLLKEVKKENRKKKHKEKTEKKDKEIQKEEKKIEEVKTVEVSLFSEKDFKEKKKPKKKDEYVPPTLDEVSRCFYDAGGTMSDAKEFYYFYDSQNWHKSNGLRIGRIDSAVNCWILNKTKKNGNKYKSEADKKRERNERIEAYVRYGGGETNDDVPSW